jgi:dihydrofolate reductase
MKALVSVDKHWGIGYRGSLLVKIPEDMRLFKQTTIGQVIIMGRGTFESLPGQKPLPERINLVLSTKDLKNPGILVCHSLRELAETLKKYPGKEVFLIGGEEVFLQLLPYCTEAYVTKIQNTYPADRFFPNLDETEAWELVTAGPPKNHQGLEYCFTVYRNRQPLDLAGLGQDPV